jgi:hypothetical protein
MANGVGTALYRRGNVNFVQGALGAKFGIPRFGKSNEFFKSGDFDPVRRQIFVKIRCDRSQIVHPRTGVMPIHQSSNRAAEWVNRSKCSGDFTLLLAAGRMFERAFVFIFKFYFCVQTGCRREHSVGMASPLTGHRKRITRARRTTSERDAQA